METQKNIVIVIASEIKNLELAQVFKTTLESMSAKVTLINLVELNLPLYTSRAEALHKGDELLKNELPFFHNAHGYVFIAPEYNGSTPPVFNNFLAWLSRSSKDWRHFLNGKPAALATFSGGGGFNVLMTMRTQLAYIGMNVIGRQVLTHSSKPLDESSLKSVAQELLKISC